MADKSKAILPHVIGVDVAKDTLDIHCLMTGQYLQVENQQSAITAWLKTISQTGVIMLTVEKTGGYEERLRELCVEHLVPVHVAHPARVHYFAKQKGYFAKTDRIDARILAEYTHQEQVTASPIPTKEDKALKEMIARRVQ
jgi:transposase